MSTTGITGAEKRRRRNQASELAPNYNRHLDNDDGKRCTAVVIRKDDVEKACDKPAAYVYYSGAAPFQVYRCKDHPRIRR